MKKLLLVSCVVLFAMISRAQPGTISLNLDAGYNFGANMNYDNVTLNPQGAFQWGGGFEFFPTWDQSIEIKYLRSDPTVAIKNSLIPYNDVSASMTYLLFWWNKNFCFSVEKF